MPAPSPEATGAFVDSWSVPRALFVSGDSAPRSGFDEELRRLLRRRLILVHLLVLACILLLAVLSRLTPTGKPEAMVRFGEGYWWGVLVALFAEGLIGTLALWRWSGMSLWLLRKWELIFFATLATTSGLNRFESLAAPIEDAARSVPALAVGFSGLTSLFGFVILILAYGVLIPNTRRRSLLVVVALAPVYKLFFTD